MNPKKYDGEKISVLLNKFSNIDLMLIIGKKNIKNTGVCVSGYFLNMNVIKKKLTSVNKKGVRRYTESKIETFKIELMR